VQGTLTSTASRRFLFLTRDTALLCTLVAVALVFLVVLPIFAAGTLMALRGYVAGESIWAKAQKDAVYHLLRYASSADEGHFRAFEDAIAVTLADRRAREELDSPSPDPEVVRQSFVAGGNHPDDVTGMSRLFRWLRRTPDMDHAIAIWAEGDREIEQLVGHAQRLRSAVAGGAGAAEVRGLLAEIQASNERLRLLEDAFSATLGQASRRLSRAMVVSGLAGGAALLALVVLLPARLLRRAAESEARYHEAKAHEELERRFRGLVESAPDAIVIVNQRAEISIVNAQTECLFGYTRDELLGKPVELLLPQGLPPLHAPAAEGSEGVASELSADCRARRKDGSELPVEIRQSPVETADGLLISTAIRDVSERKRFEARLRALNEALEQRVAERTAQLEERARQLARSNAELEQFASVVSHDLKSPLRGISSLAEWIAEDHSASLGEEGREQLALLRSRARRMHRLIDGILEYSRAGRAVDRKDVDVARVVSDVIDALAPPEGIEVRVEPPLPRVRYDEVQLTQVLQNLIGNAIQHMGSLQGMVIVSAREQVDAWEVSVSDTGAGIPKEHQERVFRMFQTLHRSQDAESTGIGLAVVKKVVEGNGGRVTLDSSPGAGTRVAFTIPKDLR
jgi:PAS domain S-box-containing protein